MRILITVGLLLLVGCSEPKMSVPVERTNVGNGGNVVIAQFRQGMIDSLVHIENSYRATEYAKRVNIDLKALRSLLDSRAYDLVAVNGPLHDKLGSLVHCRVIGRRLEIDQDYWGPEFDAGAADQKTRTHELLRLHPDRPSDFDDDYLKSIALATLMTDSTIVTSGLPKGMVVQLAEPTCSVPTLEVHWEESERKLSISYYANREKFFDKYRKSYLHYGSFFCGVRLSQLPIPEEELSRLTFSLETTELRTKGSTTELEVGIRLPQRKEQSFSTSVTTETTADALKKTTIDFSTFGARKSLKYERSENDLFVRVQATPWGNSNLLVRPESIEIQF